jgi:hypothetical protein
VSSTRKLVGWNDAARMHKTTANFWFRIWEDAGCPSSGVLFQIKKNTKRRYKYEVRRLKRRQKFLLQRKLANLFAKKNKKSFWCQVKRLNCSSSTLAPVVDGLTGTKNIANLFASNLERVFNTYSPSPHSSVYSSSMSVSDLCEVQFSEDDVLEAVSQLKPNKSDADGLFSEHKNIFCSISL